jgi:prepilin-type N-terminal cleavage/methylation domain-containing protein
MGKNLLGDIMKIRQKKKNRGFSLLELILVLAISSLAFLGFLQMERKKQELASAENAGSQINEMGQALGSYITMEYSALQTLVPPGATSIIPIAAFQSSVGTQAGPLYNNRLLLPTTYLANSIFSTPLPIGLTMYINNTGGQISGLVLSNSPIVDASGAVKYDWIGTAMRKMGAGGGMTFLVGTTLSGLNGSWSITNAKFPAIAQTGLVGYRVNFQGSYDNTYLRLDGMYPMNGNLNMGNYNINNATDISYTGWLYGNNGVMNNLMTGTITNAGNVTTLGATGKTTATRAPAIATTNGSYAGGNASFANFDLLYANCINCGVAGEAYNAALPTFNAALGDIRVGGDGAHGSLFVNDIILGTATGPVSGGNKNAFLSDRLPRYADRGIILVNNGGLIPKPVVTVGASSGYVCRWTGIGSPPVPKIEVVPAVSWIQGAVLGPMNLSFAGSGINAGNALVLNGTITQQQYSVGGSAVYATSAVANWQVWIQTPNYDGVSVGGSALAHIYCDYGN